MAGEVTIVDLTTEQMDALIGRIDARALDNARLGHSLFMVTYLLNEAYKMGQRQAGARPLFLVEPGRIAMIERAIKGACADVRAWPWEKGITYTLVRAFEAAALPLEGGE